MVELKYVSSLEENLAQIDEDEDLAEVEGPNEDMFSHTLTILCHHGRDGVVHQYEAVGEMSRVV